MQSAKLLRQFDTSGAENTTFREDQLNTMVADALAPNVPRPAVSVISVMHDKRVQKDGFNWRAPSQR